MDDNKLTFGPAWRMSAASFAPVLPTPAPDCPPLAKGRDGLPSGHSSLGRPMFAPNTLGEALW